MSLARSGDRPSPTYAGEVLGKGWMWLIVGAAAALFVPAFAMLVIADDGWVATTGEALLVP